ncbi:MAG: hypothetical protein QM608_21645 [Caulobacter sp.]
MTRRYGHHHEGAWSGAAMLAVLLFVALLIYAVWRSGLLAVRPDIAELRLPEVAPPTMPTPNPEPLPTPLPRPG